MAQISKMQVGADSFLERHVDLLGPCPGVTIVRLAFINRKINASYREIAIMTTIDETIWNGFTRFDFTMQAFPCIVIFPKTVAPGNPWIWRTEFFDAWPAADIALLNHGFHVVNIQASDLFGASKAIDIFDTFYEYVVENFQLCEKMVLEGFSRGGLYALKYAERNPERVHALYLDAPVCDFRSWPGGFGMGPGCRVEWDKCLKAYEFTQEQALNSKENAIHCVQKLASAKIPILTVCGLKDEVVPYNENTGLFAEMYKNAGGEFHQIIKPFGLHHPHSLSNPRPIVEFALQRAYPQGLDVFLLKKRHPTPFDYDYYQCRAGLERCRSAFDKGFGRVVFLGGSITHMENGWRDLVASDLQNRYPDTAFEFINAGIPSLGSTAHSFRFNSDVLKQGPVDLLFVEAAVNDEYNGQSELEMLRGMEGIIRQARISNPCVDIIMLHFADPDKCAVIRRGVTPAVIVQHERVADHYGLASINLALEVTERMAASEFSWEDDFKDLHPSRFGHELYARSIQSLLDAAWHQPLSSEVAPYTLPCYLDKHSYWRGRYASIHEAHGNPAWQMIPDWSPSDQTPGRDGFVNIPVLECGTPDAELVFEWEGTAAGILVLSGPDAGWVRYQIDDQIGGLCNLRTIWSDNLHLPWAQMFASGLPCGKHRLCLSLHARVNSDPKPARIRIVHFLAN
jgi:sialidase-1